MALDLYSPCPCGSGKKFKWCCQPIHGQISRAFEQDADGQHDAALRTMDQIIAEHPDNPVVYGRQAQLLYANGRVDDAEAALDKAFGLNPNYAFGYFLRGTFRQHEGEIAGALLLFRKAAERYDTDAREILSEVFAAIAECELKLNRPVAGRAALKKSQACHAREEIRQALDQLFGEQSHFPRTACRDYAILSPSASGPAGRLAAWERAWAAASSGKLSDVQRAFEQLTGEAPEDSSAWYNLALARSWLGDNARALEALDRYVSLEGDEGRAAAAWSLGEVLRFGAGMEDQADYVEHSVLLQLRDAQRFFQVLQEWENERRLTGVQVRQEEGVISALVLEKVTALTAESAARQLPHLGAYLLLVGGMLRLWHTNADALDRVRQELQQRAGPALGGAHTGRTPANFSEVLADALVFPVGLTDQAEIDQRIREHVQKYFEDAWIHRPLRSLGGVPPVDAAGHGTLRKKLFGVIQFLQECTRGNPPPYDYDRLRRKLGLLPSAAGAGAESAAAPVDIGALGAAELAALPVESLSDAQVEQAYQAAQRLDAHELAAGFARTLVSRPPQADRPDRYPWYAYLTQRALTENNLDAALDLVNEGEKADCERNEGRRRNDYELRRGQVLTKRGETESAREVFQRLIERVPSNLRFRSSAAESMLSARQGAAALQFAEQGLVKAREQNDRDSEEHFKELAAAARKQGG
jgi:tetratricopeptide (TPR) repeat protein